MDKGLVDYKFFCFDGKPRFLYVSQDMTSEHAKCTFMDMAWNKLPVTRRDYPPMDEIPERPDNFEEMVRVAEMLSEDFPHVRVDLYNIKGRVIFGELTFYNASGYTNFNPDSYDYTIGEMFDVSGFL